MSLFRYSIKRQQASLDRDVSDLQPNDNTLTMEDFQFEVMRALWHPFELLDNAQTGKVQISRLKVITSNIGLRLGHKKAEELLNKDDVTVMTFEDFFQVIKQELLDKIPEPSSEEEIAASAEPSSNTTKVRTLPDLLHGIVKTCWSFCSFERENKVSGMTIENCMILWRVFNLLSECEENRKPIVPLRLHPDEVDLLLRQFIDYTGQRNKESVIKDFVDRKSGSDMVTFTEFINLFEKDFVSSLSRNDISQGLHHLFDRYIMNILAKENMWKRGYNVKHWKERWLVLTTTGLKYYVNNTERAQKGEILFDSDCSVELPPDRPTNRPHRFIVHTKKKPYEISAPDARTKNEWVSAIQVALNCVGENPNVEKEAAFQRCLARINKKRQAEGEERKRLEEAEYLRKQQEELNEEKRKRLEDEKLLRARLDELEEERKMRAEMEDKLSEEQRLREEEQQRLRELEAIKRELERLLEEERQAKKDEEIVRNLQARLLEEEFQKREELERLKQQQEEMLRAEREQKAELEVDKKEQERILQEAKAKLEQLERERAAAAEKMQEAAEKLQKAEKDRHIMEERVKLYNTKTSVGLRRPVEPKIDPFATHRGPGAFSPMDFEKRSHKHEDTETKNRVEDEPVLEMKNARTVDGKGNSADNDKQKPEHSDNASIKNKASGDIQNVAKIVSEEQDLNCNWKQDGDDGDKANDDGNKHDDDGDKHDDDGDRHDDDGDKRDGDGNKHNGDSDNHDDDRDKHNDDGDRQDDDGEKRDYNKHNDDSDNHDDDSDDHDDYGDDHVDNEDDIDVEVEKLRNGIINSIKSKSLDSDKENDGNEQNADIYDT